MLRYQLSRRDFIRTATVAGITVGVFGLSGCAPLPGTGTGRGSGFTPGTYQAEGDGKFAPITVEVTMSETGIVDVRVVSHEETEYISDRAIAEIPEKIVEFQSLDIDAVTGATLTSMAILSAARECVSQAGSAGALASTYERPVPSDEVIELEADVVIAGAGASGMAAAIACAQRGASVIVVEKSCNIGGNGLVCGGYLEYPELPKELRPAMTDVQRDEVNELIAAAEVRKSPQTIWMSSRTNGKPGKNLESGHASTPPSLNPSAMDCPTARTSMPLM